MIRVEHKPGEELIIHFALPKLKIIPDETRKHLAEAKKQCLLAFRSLLDIAIEKAEEATKSGEKTRAKIEVQ